MSGPVSKIFVDYNSPVKTNSLLAQIDDMDYETRLNTAQSGLARTRAELEQAKAKVVFARSEYSSAVDSNQRVKDTVPQSEVASRMTNVAVAKAAVAAAEANVKQSESAVEEAQRISITQGSLRRLTELSSVAASILGKT